MKSAEEMKAIREIGEFVEFTLVDVPESGNLNAEEDETLGASKAAHHERLQ